MVSVDKGSALDNCSCTINSDNTRTPDIQDSLDMKHVYTIQYQTCHFSESV